MPWISEDTANKKIENNNEKVRDIIQQVEAAAEAYKVFSTKNLLKTKSTTELFKYFSAFSKENFPKNMTHGEKSADNDLPKANPLQTSSLRCLSNP